MCSVYVCVCAFLSVCTCDMEAIGSMSSSVTLLVWRQYLTLKEHDWQVECIMNSVNTSLVQRSKTLKQLDEMFYPGAEDLTSDP